MFPPFSESAAYNHCISLAKNLNDGFVYIEQEAPKAVNRSQTKFMIGALVTQDKNGNEIIVHAISGIRAQLKLQKGIKMGNLVFAPSISSYKQVQKALSKNDKKIHKLTDKINLLNKTLENSAQVEALKKKRISLCSESLKKVHSIYSFHTFTGEKFPLSDICKTSLPPTGTGDCAEIKMLDYAIKNNLTPVSMCQIQYDSSQNYTAFTQNEFPKIPPCNERCALLIPKMLGLEILYRDNDIIVVNKQSGVLSVPGRGPDKQDCIVNRVKKLFPNTIQQPAVHRLDMETSGILILAFTKEAHRELNRQFEAGEVKKNYIALLDGNAYKKNIPQEGQNELYFRLDVDNRPHQIWDEVYGKKAITQWKILQIQKYTCPDGTVKDATRVLFIPHTGRTHQLRLASSDPHGFGIPIIGDTLYGNCIKGERLMLHACYIKFTHPITGKPMEFNCPPEY